MDEVNGPPKRGCMTVYTAGIRRARPAARAAVVERGRPVVLTPVDGPHCRSASAPPVIQNFSAPFTRTLNGLISDSTIALVIGKPSRRYRV